MRREEGLGYHITGPGNGDATDDEVYEQLADLWQNCSVQIQRVCQANQSHYLHFLPPNQYIAGSKPLSEEERENCYLPEQGYAVSVVAGYPRLRERGPKLVAQGVRFHDLTMLFQETEETTYSDWFCHFNQRGNDMLAEQIAAELIKVLESH